MTLFDSHAHITHTADLQEIESSLVRAKNAGVGAILNIGTNAETAQRGIEISKKYPWVYNAAATTPHDVEKEGEELFPFMETLARSGTIVAVGETGLDYYYQHSDRSIQKRFLQKYLRLALECHLPVIIHCREAFSDLFTILDSDYKAEGKLGPGVLHCFTGTVEEAKEVIHRGWYLSLSGIVTFKKSDMLREVARFVPLEQLLIETDTPYLAPQSKRGHKNEPAFIVETARCIADIKGISFEELATATYTNACKAFLKDKTT